MSQSDYHHTDLASIGEPEPSTDNPDNPLNEVRADKWRSAAGRLPEPEAGSLGEALVNLRRASAAAAEEKGPGDGWGSTVSR